jgi:hypothetical protein
MAKVIKKAQDGIVSTGKQNRLARQEKRVYDRYTDAKASGNIKRSGRLYDKLMDKQTKSIKAGVNVQYKSGGMIKRADGSMSKRGLWDNIRANKGSGKKPTAAMLKQEKKIKAKAKK